MVPVFARGVDREKLMLLGPCIVLELVLVPREVEGLHAACVVDRDVGQAITLLELWTIAEVEDPFQLSVTPTPFRRSTAFKRRLVVDRTHWRKSSYIDYS